jgi:DNA-binding transcriptional ArsR family regulator
MTSSEHPDTPAVDDPNTPTPSLDAIFDLLSNEHRRYILYYFHEQPQAVATVDELVTYLLTQFDARAAEDADRLRIQLLYSHLPKLEGHGILEYDERSETVRYRDEREIERVVAVVKSAEIPV